MLPRPRGKLINFPGHVPELEDLPEGTLLEPGMEIRFRGKLWRVDDECHCDEVDDEYADVPTLIDREGLRYCLLCGELSESLDFIALGDAWIPDEIRERVLSELGIE